MLWISSHFNYGKHKSEVFDGRTCQLVPFAGDRHNSNLDLDCYQLGNESLFSRVCVFVCVFERVNVPAH